ncbi:MAG: hypothetical protein AAGG75_24215 [Bacteroidota bacterium]
MTSFPLDPLGPLSEGLLQRGVHNFSEAVNFVRHLPYRRTSDKERLMTVLEENCGTCSIKHAFLKQVATEQDRDDIELVIGIYQMNQDNTPGIGNHLVTSGLPYLPEAHCYLRYQGQRFDYTLPESDIARLASAIVEEKTIEAHQIGAFKVTFHQNYLRRWLTAEGLTMSLEQLWQIREQCIASLSK